MQKLLSKLFNATIWKVVLLLILFFSVVSVVNYQVVGAQSASQEVCESVGGTYVDGKCDGGDGELGGSDINEILKTVLSILSFIAGFIAVIMIIVAGIKFVTSQGDAQKTASARNTVIYAVVGIVIVLLSQIIVRFVLSEATTPPSETQQSNPPANAQ